MNNINSLLNQHQISPLHEIHSHGQLPQMLASSQFDPAVPPDDFLEQMLASVPPSAAAAFPWSDYHSTPQLEEPSTAVLVSKLRNHQISNGAVHNEVVDGNGFNSANSIGDFC